MKINKKYILILVFISSLQGFSQEILTKKEALKITLENNFGIKIANNNLEVAKNNTSIFNSGFLPTTAVSTGANYRRDNQDVTFQDGTSRSIAGAITKSYNASVNVNYTIFDGLGRKYNYQQLKETYNLSELQARETIENTYLQLFTTYFQIARLSENANNLSEALGISKRRLLRAKYQYDYGQATKLEMLNAEVDVNNDSILFITAKQQLNNVKRSLNIILGIDKCPVSQRYCF
jgi:outer membrane protein TolC